MNAPNPEPARPHNPFTDDGVTYCGWDSHGGCGELWPCSTVRAGQVPAAASATTADDSGEGWDDAVRSADVAELVRIGELFRQQRDAALAVRDAELTQLRSMHDDAERRVDARGAEIRQLRRFTDWIVSLDDPANIEQRRRVSLNEVIARAASAGFDGSDGGAS